MITDNKDKKNIKVVIGANYGSEGKGMVTDYLCSKNLGKTLVVLTNGGGQRGHTVETVYGDVNVFHNLGSGTLRGCDTYISKYFILNPIMFAKEMYMIQEDYPDRRFHVYINRDVKWSTQYDMLLNQMLLYKDGLQNSTGFGIYETQYRYKDLLSKNQEIYTIEEFYKLRDSEKYVYLNYLFGFLIERMQECGVELQGEGIDPYVWDSLRKNRDLKDSIVNAMKAIESFVNSGIVSFTDDSIMDSYTNIVFENGQGLLLDKDFDKSYGTSSKTGLIIPYNMIESRFSGQDIEVLYVSRSYLTRHGDGHLTNELKTMDELRYNLIFPEFEYEINIENDFQGKLRYAPLDLEKLVDRVISDLEIYKSFGSLTHNSYKPSIVITHMNECEIEENDLKVLSYSYDLKFYRSYGRTSEHIRECRFWEE